MRRDVDKVIVTKRCNYFHFDDRVKMPKCVLTGHLCFHPQWQEQCEEFSEVPHEN